MLSSVVLSLLLQATLTYGYWILVDNGGHWGDWGKQQRCPPMTSARGISLQVEHPLGSGDDTALNGIKLHCTHCSSTEVIATITSTVGNWGQWTSISWCPSGGSFIGFTLMVEKPQGNGDDTAANNIIMKCTDQTPVTGNGGPWGDYGNWSEICKWGICGIQSKVEPYIGSGDDTALNDVRFECCL